MNRSRLRRCACQSVVVVASFLILTGCSQSAGAPGWEPPVPAGGSTTTANRSSSSFEMPAPNLSGTDMARHFLGDGAFEQVFVAPPAEVGPGLGPDFNNRSCANCHVRNGRGLPVLAAGGGGSQALIRVSLGTWPTGSPAGQTPVPGIGTQLQDHALAGLVPEADISLRWMETERILPFDSAPVSMRSPVFSVELRGGISLGREVETSMRVPAPVFGLGLLEAVPDDTLWSLSDPDDEDGDGISGRVNLVQNLVSGESAVGRFGWKASQSSLLQQAASAYFEDMGVTSPLFPESDGSSEIDWETLSNAAFYTQTLAVPARVDPDDPDVRAGESVFREIGCEACHVERLVTGPHEVDALAHQTIAPYSDLLLHNVGMGLADGRPDFEASGSEWRTAPLWGLGVTRTVLGAEGYLHDGRARSLTEAILWHGGEALGSSNSFAALSGRDRARLLAFLRSL